MIKTEIEPGVWAQGRVLKNKWFSASCLNPYSPNYSPDEQPYYVPDCTLQDDDGNDIDPATLGLRWIDIEDAIINEYEEIEAYDIID